MRDVVWRAMIDSWFVANGVYGVPRRELSSPAIRKVMKTKGGGKTEGRGTQIPGRFRLTSPFTSLPPGVAAGIAIRVSRTMALMCPGQRCRGSLDSWQRPYRFGFSCLHRELSRASYRL